MIGFATFFIGTHVLDETALGEVLWLRKSGVVLLHQVGRHWAYLEEQLRVFNTVVQTNTREKS